MLKALIKTMRPRQWTKNGFIFFALIFDKQLFILEPFLLFIALALALIDRVWAGSSGWVIGLFGGLLILTRPEGLLLFGLGLGVLYASRQAGRGALIEIGKAVLAFLIVLAPGASFNLQAGGSIFPNTFYAKQSEYGELMSTLSIWAYSIGSMLIAPLAGGGVLLLPGVMLWAAQNRRDVKDRTRWMWWLPLVWATAHITVYALRLPVSYQHGRYLLPIIPILLLYGVVGTALLLDWLKARNAKPGGRVLRQVFVIAIVVLLLLYIPIGAPLLF